MAIQIQHIKQQQNQKKHSEHSGKNFFSFLNKEIHFGNNSLSDKKKEAFYSELNILLSSGIDIRSALDIIVEEQVKIKEKELFTVIRNKVINGMSLSEAIEKSGKFTPYEYHSLRIGEESGKNKRCPFGPAFILYQKNQNKKIYAIPFNSKLL
ncbi:MAG: hypothetical protein HC905_18050 [Bacteroidales bacterium]|nr:hypothetical protein [Bacteroidales bacterium]